MLRVYGMTYTFTTNYGTCFQAYALQTAMESMTVCGEHPSYLLIPSSRCPGYPLPIYKGIKGRLRYWVKSFVWKQFSGFDRRYMKYAPVCPVKELSKLNDQADAFVCGSDVIWNSHTNHGFSGFYLDFARKYKFSYAASFGKAVIDESLYRELGDLLSSFDAISVREPSGAEIVRKCVDKPICVVADPVLLLKRADWEQILPDQHKKEKYIFFYATYMNSEIEGFLEQLRKNTGLKVINASWGIRQMLKTGKLLVQKPDDWLALIRDAEYVVTNSFHATAFSVMFHKKFFTVVRGGKERGSNVGLFDFLESVGLSERLFSAFPDTIDLTPPDFSRADKTIEEKRRFSMAFLQENLEAAYREKQKREQEVFTN